MTQTVLLGEVAEVIDSLHQTPKYSKIGYPMVRVTDIKPGFLKTDNCLRVSREVFDLFSKKHKPKKGDIVLSRVGSEGVPAYVNSNEAFCLGQNTVFIIPKINSRYLYYWLVSPEGKRQIAYRTTGSTQKTLSLQSIKTLKIDLPDTQDQERVAEFLGEIDEKIELNRRINETLEQMGQALFRHHFITNPEAKNWGKKPVGKFIDVALGGDWGEEQPDEKHIQKVRVIRGTDMGNVQNGNIEDVPERFVETKKYETRRLLPGDILIEISGGSNTQPTGRSLFITQQTIDLLGGSVIPASFCRLVRAQSPEWATALITFLEHLYSNGKMWDYQNRSTGISNFQFKYFAENASITDAPLEMLKQFHAQARPLLIKRAQNAKEIQTLTTLRDTLLPRLISGKVRV